MRVGLFTESFDPVINGVSTSVKTLAAELQAAGHEPVVVAPRFPGFEDEPDEPVSVRRLPSMRTIFNPQNPFVPPPPLLGPSPTALRGAAFDVVHTHHPFGLGAHGRRCARALGVPLVSTNHTLYLEYTHYFPVLPTTVTRAIVSAAMRGHYNACDAVIAPSAAAGRILEGLGVTTPVHIVPTGVPAAPSVMPAAAEQTRRTYALPPNAPVLLFVGRVAREKNIDLLVDAFARVVAGFAGDDAAPILLLVGSGPYVEAARRRVRAAGVEGRVRFAGFLKRDQLAPVYAAATLFVFPSATDTQGVVLSEAQSHGLPCVVVDAGGAPEFVRANVDALVVPPGDVDAFAAAVRTLLGDDARRRAFAAAALDSPLRPTPADMARRIIDVYAEVQERRRTTTTTPPGDAGTLVRG